MGYSWPRVFLLGASGRTGRFFTQLLFHTPISVSLWFSSLELNVTRIVYYFSMICHISFSLNRGKHRKTKKNMGKQTITCLKSNIFRSLTWDTDPFVSLRNAPTFAKRDKNGCEEDNNLLSCFLILQPWRPGDILKWDTIDYLLPFQHLDLSTRGHTSLPVWNL